MYKKYMKRKLCVVFIYTPLFLVSVFTATAHYTNIEDNDGFYNDNVQLTKIPMDYSEKTQLSFAAFTDTHIGAKYQLPLYGITNHLDLLGKDMADATNKLDFAVHLGDIVNHNTGQVNGQGLPWFVNQYTNNVKAFFISQVNIPLYCVMGNHDVNDYQMNSDNPHNLTQSLIDELCMNNPVYAMMYDGILFLVVPELGYITWTHPVEYEWLEYMTSRYPNATTIILCHQAIEDTTQNEEDRDIPYSGKQDIDWWTHLFQNNPQITLWIHGHNHYLDWYVSNQSTGLSYPIQHFGHDMAFSSPYPQMNWRHRDILNRIVIYNITSSNITTAAWENTGTGGHWVSDYRHSWDVPTTFDPTAEDWYSFPMFLQDNETQCTDMKVLSPDITLELIGTKPMELFFDPQLESPSGWAEEKILGFGSDRSENISWINPGMRIHGRTSVTFPEKYPYDYSVNGLQEDGRSGQPYHSFPMGTICAAVPGQTYRFTMTARCPSGDGYASLNVSCSDWAAQSQYSMLPDSESQVFSHRFGSNNETISGAYIVPNDTNAWFLQGTLTFLNSTDYEVSLFSVKREQTNDTTDNFHVRLSGHWYNVTGSLEEHETVTFTINPASLSDVNGVMEFTAFIEGNRYGMVNLLYHEPILFGMNARFRINGHTDTTYNLSLTKTISRNSAFLSMMWDSPMYQNNPLITDVLVRLLMKGLTGHVLHTIVQKLIPKVPPTFMVFPFSTDSLYNQVTMTADDGSGMKHVSKNGNLWFSCNGPDTSERSIEVTIPSS
jgi:hypothetical protein